jgi:hypothetical protein
LGDKLVVGVTEMVGVRLEVGVRDAELEAGAPAESVDVDV